MVTWAREQRQFDLPGILTKSEASLLCGSKPDFFAFIGVDSNSLFNFIEFVCCHFVFEIFSQDSSAPWLGRGSSSQDAIIGRKKLLLTIPMFPEKYLH